MSFAIITIKIEPEQITIETPLGLSPTNHKVNPPIKKAQLMAKTHIKKTSRKSAGFLGEDSVYKKIRQ